MASDRGSGFLHVGDGIVQCVRPDVLWLVDCRGWEMSPVSFWAVLNLNGFKHSGFAPYLFEVISGRAYWVQPLTMTSNSYADALQALDQRSNVH